MMSTSMGIAECMAKTTGKLREGLGGSGSAVPGSIYPRGIARALREALVLMGKAVQSGICP